MAVMGRVATKAGKTKAREVSRLVEFRIPQRRPLERSALWYAPERST